MKKTYKGFNKDLTCRDMVYEIGKTYTTDSAEVCKTGFHACEVPLECLYYYSPNNSVYCSVIQDGELSSHERDSKIASTKITIDKQLDVGGLIFAQKEYLGHHPNMQNITADLDNKAVSADNYSFCTVEEDGLAVGKNYSCIQTGNFGTAVGNCCSVVQGRAYSTVVVGSYSIARGGFNSTVVARDASYAISDGSGTALTQSRGNSLVGAYGCAVTGEEGRAKAGIGGIALGGMRSAVEAESMGIAVGGNDVVVGNWGIGVVRGNRGRAKGGKGATLVFIETNNVDFDIKNRKVITIDGEEYKEDTYYTMIDGKVIPCE